MRASVLTRTLAVLALSLLGVAGGATTALAGPPPVADRTAAAEAAATPGGMSAVGPTGPITTADTTCNPGDLCFWVNENKGGAKGRVSGDNSSWSWAQSSCANGTWNNCASSIQNNGRTCTVNVFEHAGYGGARLTLVRGTYISSLGGHWITFPVDSWNDDIQSNRWC
jgi:hypothetical protein